MGLAPTGYMHVTNDKGEKTIVLDPDRAEGKKMLTEICEPFSTMIGYYEDPTNWRWRELNSRPKQTTS